MLNARFCLTGCLLLGVRAAAGAEFTDRATFLAAAGDVIVEDFQAVPVEEVPESGGTIATAGFDLIFDRNHGLLGVEQRQSERQVFADVHRPSVPQGPRSPEFIRLEFPHPITAFGVDLDRVRINNLTGSFGPVDLVFGPTATAIAVPASARQDDGFFGVTLPPGESAAWVEFRTTASWSTFVFDNVTYAVVPEPATLWVVALLGGYARARRGATG